METKSLVNESCVKTQRAQDNIIMEEKIKKAFAVNLKNLIGNMSISEFAKRVDIPQQTISRYLLCQREISLTNLCKIADYFEEDIDVLIGRKD